MIKALKFNGHLDIIHYVSRWQEPKMSIFILFIPKKIKRGTFSSNTWWWVSKNQSQSTFTFFESNPSSRLKITNIGFKLLSSILSFLNAYLFILKVGWIVNEREEERKREQIKIFFYQTVDRQTCWPFLASLLRADVSLIMNM